MTVTLICTQVTQRQHIHIQTRQSCSVSSSHELIEDEGGGYDDIEYAIAA